MAQSRRIETGEAQNREEHEAFLTSEAGRSRMIEWLVERGASDHSRDALASLSNLELARLFAEQQYLDQLSRQRVNDLDIPLLGRIASQYVAIHMTQSERGRSGGARSKRKEGIWNAALHLATNGPARTAREAFRHILSKTNANEALRLGGWVVTATQPGVARYREGKICQKNLLTGKTAEIGFRSFENDYWRKAKQQAQQTTI